MRRALMVALLLGAACSSEVGEVGGRAPDPSGRRDSAASPSPEPTAQASPTPSQTPAQAQALPPAPDRRLPRDPRRLAAALDRANESVRESVTKWTTEGDPARPRVPRVVVLHTLYQQRIVRLLSNNPALARGVFPRLEGPGRHLLEDIVEVSAGLRRLTTPLESASEFKTQRPEPPGVLMRYYRRAERRFGVDRHVLASVNYIESKFGRISSASSAGAQGPMQFLPSTWAAYGLGGDIGDPRDSIMGAANYLRASGAGEGGAGGYRRALFAYNHSDIYVDAVLAFARAFERDIRNYYAIYNWQVFVITTRGDVRLTGPGL